MLLGAQLILLAVSALWGWTFVLVKQALAELGTFQFLFLRFALATVILLALYGRKLRNSNLHLQQGLIIGLTLFAGYVFQTWGLLYTAAAKSGFITGLYVVLVPLLGSLSFGERVLPWAWAGTGASTAGLVMMLLAQGQTASLSLNPGDFLTLLCAVAFALQILFVSRFVRIENHAQLLVVQIAVVALLSLPGVLLFESLSLHLSWRAWQGILITGALATAFALWAQNRFQPLAGAIPTTLIFATEPVFAGIFGYLLLGERLTATQWAGAALLVCGMLLVQRRRG